MIFRRPFGVRRSQRTRTQSLARKQRCACACACGSYATIIPYYIFYGGSTWWRFTLLLQSPVAPYDLANGGARARIALYIVQYKIRRRRCDGRRRPPCVGIAIYDLRAARPCACAGIPERCVRKSIVVRIRVWCVCVCVCCARECVRLRPCLCVCLRVDGCAGKGFGSAQTPPGGTATASSPAAPAVGGSARSVCLA